MPVYPSASGADRRRPRIESDAPPTCACAVPAASLSLLSPLFSYWIAFSDNNDGRALLWPARQRAAGQGRPPRPGRGTRAAWGRHAPPSARDGFAEAARKGVKMREKDTIVITCWAPNISVHGSEGTGGRSLPWHLWDLCIWPTVYLLAAHSAGRRPGRRWLRRCALYLVCT